MATQKPQEWVVQLITRFEDQLPCRTGPQTHHSRINVQQNKECLIQISKFKFSLVISGLTKILQRINELRPSHMEFERDYYDSLLIVLDTLEKCLSSQAQQVKYDEAMNVKLLLQARRSVSSSTRAGTQGGGTNSEPLLQSSLCPLQSTSNKHGENTERGVVSLSRIR